MRARRSRSKAPPLTAEIVETKQAGSRFRFSLRSLLVLVFAACVGAACVSYSLRAKEQEGVARLGFVLFPMVAPAVVLLLAMGWSAYRQRRP